MSVSELRHDALVYEHDDPFVEQVGGFLQAGLAEGAATVAVLRRNSWALLKEALGTAADEVFFAGDPQSWYRRPIDALGGYDATLRDYVRSGAPSVRVVGELPSCSTQLEWDQWKAYEAILNRAFADRQAWIVCAYDARVLPERVVEGAWHTHPQVLTDSWQSNGHYQEPEHVVRGVSPEPGRALDLRRIDPGPDVAAIRWQLTRELAAAGASGERVRDLVAAAEEVVVNTWRHAGGPTSVRVGLVEESFVCEVSDHGPGLDDPIAGYLPPDSERGDPAGLWVARQLAARVDLHPGPDGLTVRIWS